MSYNILELYSGIGGMHSAWKETGLPGRICAAVDVNTVANEAYRHNFPNTCLINRNIQSLSPNEINNLSVNTILMSPPCQPFSRNGKYLDQNDPRTDSFLYLIGILHKLDTLEYILMENVKGFESSTVRKLFIEKLKDCQFQYQEFLLCPMSMGVPNSRLRYYCIARKNNTWQFKPKNEIMMSPLKVYEAPFSLDSILQDNVPESYLVPDKLLKWANVFDICHRDSRRSCCFTKSYTHYVDGTGSIFTEASPRDVQECLEKANCFQVGSEDYIKIVKGLQFRYFTPREVSSLMMFPNWYSFPASTTTKQCYRLLGNSVNVKVIAELLKVLFDQ